MDNSNISNYTCEKHGCRYLIDEQNNLVCPFGHKRETFYCLVRVIHFDSEKQKVWNEYEWQDLERITKKPIITVTEKTYKKIIRENATL